MRRFWGEHSLWWFVGACAATVVLVLAFSAAPMLTLAAGAGLSAIAFGLKAGRDRALGVAVAGALAAATIVAPNLGLLPVFAGHTLGLAWLAFFAFFARRKPWQGGPLNLLWIVLLIGLPSSLLSPSGPYFFAILVAAFVLAIGLVATAMSAPERVIVRQAIILLACFEAILCIVETFILGRWLIGEADGWPHPLIAGAIRASGTLSHPLVVGIVMMTGLAVMRAEHMWGKAMRVTATLLLLAGIVAAGSSSVWAVTAVILVFGFLSRGSFGVRFVKLIIASAGAAYLFSRPSLFASATSDLSGIYATHRLNSIKASPQLVTERPLLQSMFGSGWGSAEETYRRGYLTNANFFAVDNQFVSVLMAAGLVGFLLVIAFLLVTLKRVRKESFLPVVALVAMFLSFDVLGWAVSGALFVILCSELKPKASPAAPLTQTAVSSRPRLHQVAQPSR